MNAQRKTDGEQAGKDGPTQREGALGCQRKHRPTKRSEKTDSTDNIMNKFISFWCLRLYEHCGYIGETRENADFLQTAVPGLLFFTSWIIISKDLQIRFFVCT